MKSPKERTQMSKKNYATSWYLENGDLAEMIYDKEKNESSFIVGSPGTLENIKTLGSLELPDRVIYPISPDTQMLKLNFLRLPNSIEHHKDNVTLFWQVRHYITKYVALPDDFASVAAVYVMFTWLYDKFAIVPYLRVIGGFGSGKTRFLTIVGNLLYKSAYFGGSTSSAGIYRTLDFIRGSLVFDETDFRNSDMTSDIIKVLNQGNDKNFPVIKMDSLREGGYESKAFQVFGPKVFASRERFRDEALESRCVTQRLYNNPSGKYPIELDADHELLALGVRRRLLAFRFENYNKIDNSEVDYGQISTPRVKQTFSALIRVANLINPKIVNQVIEFGTKCDRELKSQLRTSMEVDVLVCLIEMLRSKEKTLSYKDKIHIQDLADKFHLKFHDSYVDHGKTMKEIPTDGDGNMLFSTNLRVSAKKLGGIVAKFGIRKERDGNGFYIPATEYPRILSLQEYYGITRDMLDLEDLGF